MNNASYVKHEACVSVQKAVTSFYMRLVQQAKQKTHCRFIYSIYFYKTLHCSANDVEAIKYH